jgi:hypothetical protein
MKAFKLKPEYFTDVPETKQVKITFANGKTLISDSYGTIDHPEFTRLRNKLERLGYIEIERSWCNGDRALKPFTLNGLTFNSNDQFPCASALGIKMSIYYKNETMHNRTTQRRA